MEDQAQWVDLLTATGAIRLGHFLLSSGRHSEKYVQCAKVLEHPKNAERLGRALAEGMMERVDCVMAPPLGGILIGYEVARALGTPFLFPERSTDGFRLRREFEIPSGSRVVIVEDVITTGRTTREMIAMVTDCGAEVIVVSAIVDRSETGDIAGFPIRALVRLEIPTFLPEECPLCADSVPLVQPGSRQMKGER